MLAEAAAREKAISSLVSQALKLDVTITNTINWLRIQSIGFINAKGGVTTEMHKTRVL